MTSMLKNSRITINTTEATETLENVVDKRMNKTDLKDKAGISFNVLAKMGKGESVSLESLHKICKTLKCDIGDIIEFSDEKIDIM